MAQALRDLHEVEIEIEMLDGGEVEYKYKSTMMGDRAKIKRRSPSGERSRFTDDNAKAKVIGLVQTIAPFPGMRGDELIERACQALNLDRGQIRTMEAEVEFKSGPEIEGKI